MTRSTPLSRVGALALAVAAASTLSHPLSGQDTDPGSRTSRIALDAAVRATVTEIAGSTAYIDVGASSGLADGDTVSVRPVGDERMLGHWLVLSVASEESLVTAVGRPFPVTVGEAFLLSGAFTLPREGAPHHAPAEPVGPASADRGEAAPAVPAPPLSVRGRIYLSMNAVSSRLRSEYDPLADTRSFFSPTTRLRLEASHLPGQVTLHANVRGSYRHDPNELTTPTNSIRVYELSAEKRFDRVPVRLRIGRFYSPHEAFTGYWDGVLARVGPDGFGVGAVVGLEPDRWNESFDTHRPKQAAFLDFGRWSADRGVRGEFAAVRVQPELTQSDRPQPEHLYLGGSGRVWLGRASVAYTVQVDRDPATSDWVISDLLLESSVRLLGPLRARGRWSRRSPFYFWQGPSPVSYRRDDVGAGIAILGRGASIEGDASVHLADGKTSPSYTYSGVLRVHSFAGSRWGVSATGSVWDDELFRMLSAGGGLNRSWGRSHGRVGYRLIDSRNAWFEQRAHQVEGVLDIPVQPGVRATLLGHARWGAGLRSYRVQVSLWRSF